MEETRISSSFSSVCSRHSPFTSASFLSERKRDASLDLTLGLSTSAFLHHNTSPSRMKHYDPPPIKALMRRKNINHLAAFFVKVDMEGFPICRKLNLLAHDGYDSLTRTLCRMFNTTIISPDARNIERSNRYHVLTYQDKEGDWMIVGDLPWKMFLTDVKRMKIRRTAKCSC